MLIVGMLLFSCLFITPQFLAAIAGYNAYQAGLVALLGGLAAVPVAMLYPLMVNRLDQRRSSPGHAFIATASDRAAA